ncbi:MAG: substrate-binding domain-containing protein [Acutalibacteraceae bacterium]
MAGTALASCAAKGFDKDGAITVISREKGSGTRSAFIELFGVEVDKEDKTVETADITDKTNVMMTSVSQNANAIGYISLGSLNDSVKALKIDGAAATVENIENGSYKISRPFNIATKRALRGRRGFHRLHPLRRGTKVVRKRLHSRQTNGAYNGSSHPAKSASAARPR